MTDWTPGDRCRMVEHDNATRQPRKRGDVVPAVVESAGPMYVRARVDDYGLQTFYRESGWMSGDGTHRWRLMLPEAAPCLSCSRGRDGGGYPCDCPTACGARYCQHPTPATEAGK